MSGIKKQPHPD